MKHRERTKEIAQYQKEYRKRNPEKVKAYKQKYRSSTKELARLRNQPYRTSFQSFVPLLTERDGYKCRKCGALEKLTVNHIIPVVADGSNELKNLELLCMPCNRQEYHELVRKALIHYFK